MNSIEKIIESIQKIFTVSEENISSLNRMLSEIESKNIYNRFEKKQFTDKYSDTEMYDKANLLNALLEIVLENPQLDVVKDETRQKWINELCRIIASLYEQLLANVSDNQIWDKLSYLVMYSMLSYMADEQTISNLVIEEYNVKLQKNIDSYEKFTFIRKLESDSYYLIVLMLSNINNYDGLVTVNSCIDRANNDLMLAQKEELEKESIDIANGLKIGSFSNIIYLTSILKKFLFTGKIEEENQDIYSLINIYSYNAYHLLNGESIELKLIGHLMKYAYEQVANNSIWNIAEKSPLIRRFIENNLKDGDRYIYSLLPSQREVISEVLTPKKSIIVGMPTSAGKSLLAEMQILFSIHNYTTKDFKPTVCYIVPTNALIEQVRRDLSNDFREFHFNIETALPYYEVDEIENEILTRKHIDILISTPEKLEALIRQNHESIKNTRLVIMDEAHNIGDESRGSKFELVLATVKQNIREANFLLLSPFINNASDISEWLDDSKRNSATISLEWSPTKQYIGCNILNTKQTKSTLEFFKSARNQLGTENVEILLRKNPKEVQEELDSKTINNAVRLCVVLGDFMNQDGNILVLCAGVGTTKKLAGTIKDYFAREGILKDISSDEEVKRALEIIKLENGNDDDLFECIKYGICYHNSGLSGLVKETIEELIRNNKIKIVFATTTLAQGMNFPINTVIFDTISFRGQGARELSHSEFWNIAGRAGRAYKDKEGYVILSYAGSQKKTRANVRRYIESDIKDVISSLNTFFANNREISLDYNVLKEHENKPLLNLLQYINHILNISYDYNINTMDMAKIRSILNDSFLYHSLSKQEGYISAQRKLNNFVTQYVRHINDSKKEEMAKADELGISDISYTKVKAMIGAFIHDLRERGYNDYKVSEIILKTKKIERLTEIINIIARIPEINIQMRGVGNLDPESIARLLLGWVNGEPIIEIAKAIKRDNQSLNDAMTLCNRYLNSQMKSYMPWGINIYQNLSYDIQTENAQMLPSYIYYGVSDKESTIVSKIGVPRFAVKNVLDILKREHSDVDININNIDKLKEIIKNIDGDKYHVSNVDGRVIKEIVEKKIG